MHLSLALESYAASRAYVQAAAALLRERFPDFSLQVEGDLPPHRSVDDLCDTARLFEGAGVSLVLDGPTLTCDPDRPGRRRVLSSVELRAVRDSAPTSLRAVRIHTIAPNAHRRPRLFGEVLDFCRGEGVALALVLAPEEWADGAWANAVRARRVPSDLLVLHTASVFAPSQPPAFIITGMRRRLFTRCGYALELGRGFPSNESELESVLRAIELQGIAKGSELHIYPADALIENQSGRLPTHQHSWPAIREHDLFPPGSALSLTPLGTALADRLAQP